MRRFVNKFVNQKIILEFEKIFEEETPLKVEDYLKGGDKDIILNAAALFLGFKNQNSKYNDLESILKVFFSEENTEIKKFILDKIDGIGLAREDIVIINTYSSLKLFEQSYAKELKGTPKSKLEFEIDFFKAYLILNSEFTSRQNTALISTEDLKGEIAFPAKMFTATYAYFDKENYDINKVWITQTQKAIHLFQFLEKHENAQPLLNSFFSFYETPSWQDYLKKLIPLTLFALQNDNETFTDIKIDKEDYFRENCAFLEKLIVNIDENLDDYDFIPLRKHPFYKVDEGVYRIIFHLFVVEKIFKGLYFQFRDINEQLPKEEKVSELKSFWGYEFSEKILTYIVLESIYSKESCTSFCGKELSDMKIYAAPDYYIRKGKNILIFESKDFLIPKKAKDSFDFNIYESEFKKKLYLEKIKGEEAPKAVIQLIRFIKKLLKKEFPADQDYHYREVNIYPVLLTHDNQYDVNGFNAIINSWFLEELELLKTENKLFINRVKPLVVINIDTLIYHKSALQENKLHDIINEYISLPQYPQGKKTDFRMYTYNPFSKFIGYNYPPQNPVPEEIKSFLPTLVDEDK